MSSKKDEQPDIADALEKPACFVLMPISDPEGYEKGHFKRVYEDVFKPACDAAGYKAVRADDVRQANMIHLDILQKLIESPMALCDLSGRNPNALFELGLRQAFDKPVVLVQEVGTPQIFDIAPLRYVEYRKQLQYREVLEDQESIAASIKATQEAFQAGTGVNSIVKLLSLTRPASLTSITDADKDSALLQVIMAELGNLRTDFRKIAFQKADAFLQGQGGTFWGKPVLSTPKFDLGLLETDVIDIRKALEASIKDEDSVDTKVIGELISSLGARLTYLKGIVRTAGSDEDSESLALLTTQIKVLRNRYDKYQHDMNRKNGKDSLLLDDQ